MSEPVSEFSMRVEHVDGYEFRVRFDKEQHPELHMDEPAPLGRDRFPNPARVLAASIGNCLAASLMFCMQRQKKPVRGVSADVTVQLVRNEARRLRVGRVGVVLNADVEGGMDALGSCLDVFEDFCVVTQSVREGLQVDVTVEPA